jgi:single-strand selective monofunctional uracil DNA glycosylase
MDLVRVSRDLAAATGRLRFAPPVAYVYAPLEYARVPHEAYLRRFGAAPREVLLLGMNPGPFGMAQTGVPFGDVASVRDWLGVSGDVASPARSHPKRPVAGFSCPRCEVSGQRLWGWARERFGTPERFFERFFVANYCPLAFVEESGANRTPDHLPASERGPLLAACDEALLRVADVLRPSLVVGVGRFAEARAKAVLGPKAIRVGVMPHPSPASPAANRDWPRSADAALKALGVPLP